MQAERPDCATVKHQASNRISSVQIDSPRDSHAPRTVAVVGGGAAGFVAALFAARAGARVTLIERTRHGGKKIVVSGGGRCNVLPGSVDAARFVTASSPRVLRRILDSWPLDRQRAFFEDDLGVPLALEPETGKLFPASNRASDVRDALSDACRAAGVEMRFETSVTGIVRENEAWRVETDTGAPVTAHAVVLATGGLSVPKTGSDGFGLREAERLGHSLVSTYPALAPLTADDCGPAPHAGLSGVSLAARVRVPGAKGPAPAPRGFLFTHRGYSGPSVLDVSHAHTLARQAGREQAVLVQWADLDGGAWDALLREPGAATVAATVRRYLPTRLADALLAHADVPDGRTRADLRRDERRRLVDALAAFELPVTGDEGYRKAEVTGGGVALGDVYPGTLESRRAPGLFLCGEILDAFGPIGGYNFFWAWATGRLAGLGAARPT